MNTKTSFHNISVLMKDDFRRFWVLPFVFFIYLFLSTSSNLILQADDRASFASAAESILHYNAFGELALCGVGPVIAALFVFKYLNQVNSVTAMHILPISRKEHFIAHGISGYVMLIAPVIANALVLVILKRPSIIDDVDIYTFGAIAKVVLVMMMVMLFVYTLSLLGIMLCGTGLMAFIGAAGLNILAPCMLFFVLVYAARFLNGFTITDTMMEFIQKISPVSAYYGMNHSTVIATMIYLVLSILFTAAAYYAYSRRRLETAGDPLSFRFMIPIVCGLLTFFASSIIGLYFDMSGTFAIALVVSAVVFYILFRMLTLKSTRVFTKKTLLNLGIYGIVFAVFISIFVFDLTGYETRKVSSADYVTAETTLFNELGNDTYGLDMIKAYDVDSNYTLVLTDPENIDRLAAVYQGIAATSHSEHNSLFFSSPSGEPTFTFTKANGKKMGRTYTVTKSDLKGNEDLKAIYESDEFRHHAALKNQQVIQKEKDKLYAEIGLPVGSNGEADGVLTVEDPEAALAFAEALDKDIAARIYDVLFTDPVCSVLFGGYEHTSNATIYPSDKHAIAWLKEHGYYEKLDQSSYIITDGYIENYTDDGSAYSMDVKDSIKGMSLADFKDRYSFGTPETTPCNLVLTLRYKEDKKSHYYYSLYYESEDALPSFADNHKWTQLY